MTERTCGVVTEPFARALCDRVDLPAVQIVGGSGSAALASEETIVDLAARMIEAPASCDLPRFRPDGSLRDLDALVLTTDQSEIDRVEALAEELIGGALTISMFGLKPLADLERQRSQPIRSTARTFLGDRHVEASVDDGGSIVGYDGYKALYPFRVPISTEILDTFQLSIGGRSALPAPHPGATILNYLTRSISGLRAKDVEKVEAMTENVLTRYPEVREWILDGPGRGTFDLARVLHSLHEPWRRQRVLRLGTRLEVAPYSRAGLLDHPGFMADDLDPRRQRSIVDASHLKSRLLARFESQPAVVSFWQKHVEDRVRAVVHNETIGARRKGS